MEQSRKIRVVAVLALIVATMALLVGFSSLSAQLQILGTATVQRSEWNVFMDNIHDVISSDSENAMFTTMPQINDSNNQVINFAANMNRVGQSLSFKMDIVNEGTIDAKVSDIVLAGLENYSEYIEWTITGVEKEQVVEAGSQISDVVVTLRYKELISTEEFVVEAESLSIPNLVLTISLIQK